MPISQPRLLVVLPQLPQDPSSGAARSTVTKAEVLAARGFKVRALAVSATEERQRSDTRSLLERLGFVVESLRESGRREFRFTARSVDYRILDTGSKKFAEWEAVSGRQFDACFDEELANFQPDMILTFGGSAGDFARRKRARKQGVAVVFGLHNFGYLAPGAFAETDAILTPSQFLTDLYRAQLGVESVAIPPIIYPADVIASEHDPIFVTIVNPSLEKGSMFSARLAEDLSVRRPDIPILVIESRGSAGMFVSAGLAGGFDLRRHENIMTSPAVPLPKDIFTPARLLIAPSLREAFGRVAVEAMMNGVPPLVGDRGGLPEAVAGSGFVLPLPAELTIDTRVPVASSAVVPWIETIEMMYDDEAAYQRESRKALEAAANYGYDALAKRYVDFFIESGLKAREQKTETA